jgi:hypothetical protein
MGRPRKQRRWYRATDTFGGHYPDSNEPYSFHVGDLVPEEVVKRLSEMYFEPLDTDHPGPVEQATAAPGERRGEVA